MRLAYVVVGLLALALSPVARADKTEFKIASLAPKGSAWAKALEKGALMIEQGTEGRVKVKFFFSGSQGDEREVVRKMKLGTIHGSAITAVGLGLIKGDVRVLELPFLFKNDKELDYVRDKMAPDFEREFAEAGYILLAWGDVGWTHLYSNMEVTSKAELAKTKMWAWTDDPIVRTFFKRLGVNGVPLGVPDVLPSLQTGLIDACYGSPLAAVALQWYTKVKFATATPINYAIGALVLRKEAFSKLSPADQQVVITAGQEVGAELKRLIRKDNERAKKAMIASGVTFVTTPDAFVAELDAQGKKVWDDLAGGKLYSNELLEKVKRHLADIRK